MATTDILDVEFELTTTISPYINEDENIPDEYKINIIYEGKIIGIAEVYKLNAYTADDFMWSCDNYSIELSDIAQEFTKIKANDEVVYTIKEFDDYDEFIFIKRIGIEKEYRGKNIVYSLFEALDKYFGFGCVYLLVACPMDYSNRKFESTDTVGFLNENTLVKNKLFTTYKKAGFKNYKKSEYMYKIVRY